MNVRIVEEVPGAPKDEQWFVTVDRKSTPTGEWLPGFKKFKHPQFAHLADAESFCAERGWVVVATEYFEP